MEETRSEAIHRAIDEKLMSNYILLEVDRERLAEAIREFASAMTITLDEATTKIFDALRVMQSAKEKEELKLMSQTMIEMVEMVRYEKPNNFIKNKINKSKAKWQR